MGMFDDYVCPDIDSFKWAPGTKPTEVEIEERVDEMREEWLSDPDFEANTGIPKDDITDEILRKEVIGHYFIFRHLALIGREQ